MRKPQTNHLFRQRAKLCFKPHEQVVPLLLLLTDPSPAAITEVLMGRNKTVWLLLIRAVCTSVIGPWRVQIIVHPFAMAHLEEGPGGELWRSRKALIAFVKKSELDWGDQGSHIDHGQALSLCCDYGLESA